MNGRLLILSVLCFLFASIALNSSSAQTNFPRYVAITVELDSKWNSTVGRPTNSHRIWTTHCIVGTNTWLIEDGFVQNSRISYWLVDTNVIRQWVITKQPAADKRPMIFAGSYPEVGERYAGTFPSPDGRPSGLENRLVWLAFCSGPFLQHIGREIPLPMGASTRSTNCTDKTAVFDDGLGLPKAIEFRAPDGQLAGIYEVLQSTNFLGWNFPVQFKLMQYGDLINNRLLNPDKARLEVIGSVKKIRASGEPHAPTDAVLLRR